MAFRIVSTRTASLLSALCALLFCACYAVRPCERERCDGIDNDCDGAADEGFVDARGRYTSDKHCGACGLACGDVFESAASTRCVVAENDAPRCEIDACAKGERRVGVGACAKEPEVLCMACESDADCTLWATGARCLPDALGIGRCGSPCGDGQRCPNGFRCQIDGATDASDAQCAPEGGSCSCRAALAGTEFGCILRNADGQACAGVQRCDGAVLHACEAALDEACNAIDDDCDDAIDEGFVDERGRYVTEANCGACGTTCLAFGRNMNAQCVAQAAGAHCESSCEPGFVDVDGLMATGCECQLQNGLGLVIGADADCNGSVDETPSLIFVASSGDDANDGEDVSRPVRTIARGLLRGQETKRVVLVARGIYAGPVKLLDGVSLLGGYSPDFRQRDVVLHPVLIEAPALPGVPMLTCKDVVLPTVVDGLTIVGGDAAEGGGGSTAVYLDGCGAALQLSNLTVLAGRGANGEGGADSSARLSRWSLQSLTQLAGSDGQAGLEGNLEDNACVFGGAGSGGARQCPRGDVSGGNGGAASCPNLRTLCDNLTDPPCGNAGCTDFTDLNGVCDLAAARAIAVPSPSGSPGLGAGPGAAGEPTYAAPTNRDSCSFCDDNPTLPRAGGSGGDGAPGAAGEAGEGCDGVERVDFASGIVTAGDGAEGGDGDDGSGGGGATAGAGRAVIGNTSGGCADVAGGSGGGGGSGGCGAPGAGAGQGGGASIGLLIRLRADGSGPDLMNVRVVTASGGDGGAGGIGAAGGSAGAGGLGGLSQFWCARNGGRGGDGGGGGAGGGGSGGCGGSSHGVFVVGPDADSYGEVVRTGNVIERAGVAGRGGFAGFSPGAPGPVGQDGTATDVVTVPG